eukprot:13367822-Ditylum_brightwellii.AAC.1
MNYAKSTNKNKNNTPALLRTAITPQNDKENTKHADIQSTTINNLSNLPSALLRTTPVASQHSNSATKGDMITCDINSELPSSEDKHTQVSTSNNNNSKQSSKRSSTMPTNKPPASAVRDELLLMMQKMKNNMK